MNNVSSTNYRESDSTISKQGTSRHFAIGLARAFGGAIFFSLPLLMTMEMWQLGFFMSRFRLALFLLLAIPLLVGLAYHAGFEETFRWKDDILDAFTAYAIGFITSVLVFSLFAIIGPGMSAEEIIGKISLLAVPGGIGAILARSQLGGKKAEKKEKRESTKYGGEMFLMLAGAIFFAFNIAPTEEIVLISKKITEWHAIALAVLSLLTMHAFVYAVEFYGQATVPPGTPLWSIFLQFTVVGYALVLVISLYVLWTFGSIDGWTMKETAMATIVLGFPAALGAAAARLVL